MTEERIWTRWIWVGVEVEVEVASILLGEAVSNTRFSLMEASPAEVFPEAFSSTFDKGGVGLYHRGIDFRRSESFNYS
jgi:hypothetical protein